MRMERRGQMRKMLRVYKGRTHQDADESLEEGRELREEEGTRDPCNSS